MKDKITDLLKYTFHYNREIIVLLKNNLSQLDEKAIQLIDHTINAHQIWNSRVLKEQSFGVWQKNEVENWEMINERNFENSIRILNNFDLEERVIYQNSKGDQFENTVFEMIFHVINHSTYHRGQINLLLKKSGIEPLFTDYIFYKR